MAREVFTVTWCDMCADDGSKKEAIATETVSLGRLTREIDLCFDCRAKLIEPLRDTLRRLGVMPTAERPPRGYKGQAVAVNGPHDLFGPVAAAASDTDKPLPPSVAPNPSPCPLCNRTAGNRNALQAHIRTYHGQISLDQAEEQAGLPSSSPHANRPIAMCRDAGGVGTEDCGFGCRSPQGFRMHRKVSHGFTTSNDGDALAKAAAAAEARAAKAAA